MKKIKTEIKNKILSAIGNMSNLFINVFSKSIDLGFNSFESSQRVIYDSKARKFWALGNLYKLKKDIKSDFFQALFDTQIKSPEIFQNSDLEIIKEKSSLKHFIERNFSKKTTLKHDEYFIIIQKQYFSFGDCVLQILLKDKVCLLILNRDQSKKPWKYFEYENL